MPENTRENPVKVVMSGKKIICVIIAVGEFLLPFIMKNSKVERVPTPYQGKGPSKESFQRAKRQAYAIFGRNKNDTRAESKKPYVLSPKRIDPDESERLKLLWKFKTYICSDGRVAIRRHGMKNKKETMITDYYPDVDSAIRSRQHALENYVSAAGGELGLIAEIERNIDLASGVFLDWPGIEDSSVRGAEDTLIKSAEMLRRSRNFFKQNTFEQLEEIQGMTDVLGRINPSAMAARSATARENIGMRNEQIHALVLHNASLLKVLKNEKLQMENNLLSTELILKALLISYESTWRNSDFIIRKLDQTLHFLESVWTNPFLDKTVEASCFLIEAKRDIKEKKLQLAKAKVAAATAQLP